MGSCPDTDIDPNLLGHTDKKNFAKVLSLG